MFAVKTKSECYYGPFKTADAASRWAKAKLVAGAWIIIPLGSPND